MSADWIHGMIMLIDWVRILRPAHWMKNLFVLAPLLFARHLFDRDQLIASLIAFVLFCLFSSAVYLFNDVMDAEQDRSHPIKSRRPVASGRIRPAQATMAGILLAAGSLAAAFWLKPWFGAIGSGYLVLNLCYSRWLKKVAFLDVGTIAAGFVLRVVAGAVVIEVVFSLWLVVCTFCLACLLALGKRRHELEVCSESGVDTRPALAGYTSLSLRRAEWLLALLTLAGYVAYTLAPGTIAKFGTTHLIFTLPFPLFGILRYLRLVVSEKNKVPTEALVTDLPSLVNLAGWVFTVVLVLYDVF